MPPAKNICSLCGSRKARRACPALGREICAVCCGTKRQIEIACPPDCGYLTSARAHPPAVLQRRHDRDLNFMAEVMDTLTPSQSRLLLFAQAFVVRYAPGQLPPLLDEDVAAAAGALASTADTRAKGIIYEHQAASLPAQRLSTELQRALDALVKENAGEIPAARLNRDIAAALRRMEHAARTAATALGEGDPRTAYLDLMSRIMREDQGGDEGRTSDATGSESERRPASRLIIP